MEKKNITLQGTNISHLGKRKIIFTMPLKGADMLVPRRVIIFDQIHTQPSNHIDSSIWCITLVVAPFVWSGFFASPQKKRLPFYPSKKKQKTPKHKQSGYTTKNSPNPKKNAIFEVTNSLEIHHIFSEAQPEIWVVTSPQKLISSSPL